MLSLHPRVCEVKVYLQNVVWKNTSHQFMRKRSLSFAPKAALKNIMKWSRKSNLLNSLFVINLRISRKEHVKKQIE